MDLNNILQKENNNMSVKNQDKFKYINTVLIIVYFIIFFVLTICMSGSIEKAYVKKMNQQIHKSL